MNHAILIWDWEPLVSVASIQFGAPASPVITKYNLQKLEPACESADWDSYEFPDTDTRIYVENGCIERFSCYDNLFYKGQNLLGLSLDDIRQILGPEEKIDTMVGASIPIEYESLGLTLWMEDDVIAGATCNAMIEDD
ncbi:MAG: hypothetical protein HC921_22095 [Synechococcaceae cyanobacterium SM2_3_1]|nr:hypothetical protein [Synechococcaceae cyanobacterium SM2_3_1]